MAEPWVREICPTCRTEFVGPHVAKAGSKTHGKCCPQGHWHSLNALWNMREKVDREQNPMTPPPKKQKPPTLKSLGFGGAQEAYQLAAVYLLDAYDQAVRTAPEGTFARAVLDGAFKDRAVVARQILGAV